MAQEVRIGAPKWMDEDQSTARLWPSVSTRQGSPTGPALSALQKRGLTEATDSASDAPSGAIP